MLWLSEGALGPDEHGFVLDALAALAADATLAHRDRDLQDGRAAAFLAIRAPQGELVGVAMILVDSKVSSPKGLATRALTPQVRTILQRLAILLRPQAAAVNQAAAINQAPAAPQRRAPTPVARVNPTAKAGKAPQAGSTTRRASGTASPVAHASPSAPSSSGPHDITVPSMDLGPKEVEQVLTLELLEEPPPPQSPRPAQQMRAPTQKPPNRAPQQQPSRGPAQQQPARSPQQQLRGASSQQAARARKEATTTTRPSGSHTQGRIALYAQELVKLRPGGRMHRYQIVPVNLRSAQDSDAEERADQQAQSVIAFCRELVTWLGANRAVCEREPVSFTISISAQALTVEQLPQMLVAAMGLSQVSPACIGFEIQEAACIRHRARAEHLIRECENIGCFFVLDDFQFDSAALELLRSKALRFVKVDPKLVTLALSDKLAQARIIAIAQAARVLGIHCAAKHVNTENTKRWITAAGFDFAEGALFGAPRPLDALIGAPASGQ